jgi:hypothetical protein
MFIDAHLTVQFDKYSAPRSLHKINSPVKKLRNIFIENAYPQRLSLPALHSTMQSPLLKFNYWHDHCERYYLKFAGVMVETDFDINVDTMIKGWSHANHFK